MWWTLQKSDPPKVIALQHTATHFKGITLLQFSFVCGGHHFFKLWCPRCVKRDSYKRKNKQKWQGYFVCTGVKRALLFVALLQKMTCTLRQDTCAGLFRVYRCHFMYICLFLSSRGLSCKQCRPKRDLYKKKNVQTTQNYGVGTGLFPWMYVLCLY